MVEMLSRTEIKRTIKKKLYYELPSGHIYTIYTVTAVIGCLNKQHSLGSYCSYTHHTI